MGDIPKDANMVAADSAGGVSGYGTAAPQAAPHVCLCAMVGGLLRLALTVAAVLGVLAGAAELGLRAAGARRGGAVELSNTVPDGWTGFRLRPGVAGQEIDLTNELGMHAPRSYALAPPPGVLRVAVLGSSVVYGLGVTFADTIPGATERALEAAGHRAEVLNFGTHAFSIVNVSALLQAYVHQFEPQVVVVVVDLQVALPRWPSVHPGASPDMGGERLGWWHTLRRRASPHSALLTLLDDPRPARRWIRRATGLPLKPRAPLSEPSPEADAPAASAARVSDPPPTPPESIPAYERMRERELGAPLAAMAAFCAESSMALYLVTPYGPYFDLTEDELARMSVHHFIEDPARLHGSEFAALAAEAELITRVIRRVAARGSARVIDMLEASRASSLRTSAEFTEDGVHLSPLGNAALGKRIATRIILDLQPRSGERD
jgi:hypothetical protein